MTDFKNIFESLELYPVSHDIVVKYITSPKKITFKKIIEQNDLIATTDYVSDVNNMYSLTLNAFRNCLIYYKIKDLSVFLDVEKSRTDIIINQYLDRIKNLEQSVEDLNKLHSPSDSFTQLEHKDTQQSQDMQSPFTQPDAFHIITQTHQVQQDTLNSISYKLDMILSQMSKKINTIHIL